MNNENDFLYATTDVAIWSCAETGLSIIASSAATLKPLFVNFMARDKFFGGTSDATAAKISYPLNSQGWDNMGHGTSRTQYIRSHSPDGSQESLAKHGNAEIVKTTSVNVSRFESA